MAGCHTTCYASFVRMGKNKLSRTIFCLYLQLAGMTPILRHNGYERVSLHGGNRDSVFGGQNGIGVSSFQRADVKFLMTRFTVVCFFVMHDMGFCLHNRS